MKRRAYRWLLLMICCLLLVGCVRTRIIDKLSIIHVFGFDQEEGQLIGTALYPDYTSSRSSEKIEFLKVKAPTSTLFTPLLDRLTSTPVQLSKIRILVIGKKFAEAGIEDVVLRFITNPDIGTNTQIAVADTSAEEVLRTFKKEKSLTLADRLKQNMEVEFLPEVNLHIFLNYFFGEGMDPFVPLISIGQGDKIRVSGLAIFKDDQLKLQLNEQETFIISILENVNAQGVYKMEVEGEGKRGLIVVRGFRTYKNWDVIKSEERPELNLHLDLKWTVLEHPDWFDLMKVQDLEQIKRLIQLEIKKDTESVLTKLQEHEVDPLGIGNIVRMKDRRFLEENFYEIYPEIPIHVQVDLDIIHSGLEA